MLDQDQSTASPQRIHARGALAPAPCQLDSARLLAAPSKALQPAEPLYSIRIAESPGTLCAACGEQETGAGPVGYLDDDPICDLCLLQGSHELGMVMAVVSVTRAYASVKGAPREEQQQALGELGAFARVYETFAAKTWPARVFRILPSFLSGGDTTH